MTQSLLRRLGLAAGVVATIIAAGCGPVSSTAAPAESPVAPTAVPSASSAGGACTATDLRATSPGWGGAAGSRGADVMVENTGEASCSVDGPLVAVVDEAGSVLLQGEPPAGDAGTTIDAGASAAFSLTFSNWCDTTTPLPLRVAVVVGSELVPIEGLPLETVDDLPPCNGEGQPASISTIPWAEG